MKCVIIDDEPLVVDLIKELVSKIDSLNLVNTFNNAIDKKPLIISTTAYSDYAVEGFNLGAIHYLVKPIPFHEFLKSVIRAQQIHNSQNVATPTNLITSPESEQHFMFVRAEYENVKLNFADILYIAGLKDYAQIYTTDSKYTLTLISTIKLENLLSSKGFTRVHRSYIINKKHVNSIQKNKAVIADDRIPISESYKNSSFEKINL